MVRVVSTLTVMSVVLNFRGMVMFARPVTPSVPLTWKLTVVGFWAMLVAEMSVSRIRL